MEIIKVNISDLKEYEHNAKQHPKEQIDQIVESIKEFGFNDPIAIDENNTIIEGHGRLYALRELGYKEVECIRLSHLTEQQKKAYILAHNKLTMNTGFDLEMLNLELSGIFELDMTKFGFEMPTDKEVKEDDYETILPTEPKSKLGDIYMLGNHRLMCGDSTKAEYVSRLMNGKLANMCLTDPPYNVNYEGSNGLKIENDNMNDEQFYQFLFDFYTQMRESLIPGGAFYIFHADTSGGAFRKALIDAGMDLRQTLIWVKNTIIIGRQDYQWQHEPCLYGWKPGASHYFSDDRTQPTVIEDRVNINKLSKEQMKNMLKELTADKVQTSIIHEDKPTKNDVHPTMKPLKLCGRLIKNSSKEMDLIVDLFGGSGSTMMASEQLERVCYMMEYDPRYVDVIIDRWEKMTGKKAEFIENINDK